MCTKEVKVATITTRSVLDYVSIVWDPHCLGDIKTLEQVQRRAARYVCNDFITLTPGCITAMVDDIGWESLLSAARLSLFYKIQHGLVDIESFCYLKPSDSRTKGQRESSSKRESTVTFISTHSSHNPPGTRMNSLETSAKPALWRSSRPVLYFDQIRKIVQFLAKIHPWTFQYKNW